jgi:hypothetical protein
MMRGVPRPRGLRRADEVVPKLGVRPGIRVLRLGDVAAYDRPLEHLAGHLDHADIALPLHAASARYGLVLAFVLEPVDLARFAREIVRVTHPEGRIWGVVWKKDRMPDGAPSWDAIQEAVLPTGWVDNKILSFGADVYGTQFVLRTSKRTVTPAGKAAR